MQRYWIEMNLFMLNKKSSILFSAYEYIVNSIIEKMPNNLLTYKFGEEHWNCCKVSTLLPNLLKWTNKAAAASWLRYFRKSLHRIRLTCKCVFFSYLKFIRWKIWMCVWIMLKRMCASCNGMLIKWLHGQCIFQYWAILNSFDVCKYVKAMRGSE